ncbi:MAG: phosphoribosyl-AMP cyclohydrolase [Candidatus Dormibacteria bacterium]
MTALPRRPIETERLVLQPISCAHAPAISVAVEASRAELWRWMLWAPSSTLESTLVHLAESERLWQQGQQYGFAVTLEGRLLGGIDLRRTDNGPGEGNFGYWVADAAAGRGYMTEAATAMVEFGFQTIGLGRLELRAHVDNRASQRVAEKVGMRQEGRVRGGTWLAGSADAYIYGMIASDPRRDTRSGATDQPRDAPLISEPDFSRGMVTAVVQDEADGAVLMVAHMNDEAYRRTISTGHAWFWSRSRERLWEKGETSGNHLVVRSVTLDCDGDAVLLGVAPAGPACHTGARSCFHNPAVVARGPLAVEEAPRKPRSRKDRN